MVIHILQVFGFQVLLFILHINFQFQSSWFSNIFCYVFLGSLLRYHFFYFFQCPLLQALLFSIQSLLLFLHFVSFFRSIEAPISTALFINSLRILIFSLISSFVSSSENLRPSRMLLLPTIFLQSFFLLPLFFQSNLIGIMGPNWKYLIHLP